MHIEQVLVTDRGMVYEGSNVKITDNNNKVFTGELIEIDKEWNRLEVFNGGSMVYIPVSNIKEILWTNTKMKSNFERLEREARK